jgi:hypothetical protein
MSAMATLYVRDVPPELYEEIKRWAKGTGRSVNAEMLALLEREAERRQKNSDWWQSVLDLWEEIGPLPAGAIDAAELIREDRDHGHSV